MRRETNWVQRLAFLVVVAMASLCQAAEPAINELPLFGGRTKSASQVRLDRQFVAEAVAAAGSRAEAYTRMIDLGWDELKRNDPSAAIRRFNQAYLIDSAKAPAFDGLGVAVARQGRLDEALRLLERAVRKDPRNAKFASNLGRIHLLRATTGRPRPDRRDSDLKQALRMLDRALTLDPTLVDGYVNRAIVRLVRGERERAAVDVRHAEALDPKAVHPELKHEILEGD